VTDVVPRPDTGAQRRARVLARLHEVGVLSVADLARELGVSPMTVRRDLQRLELAGQVRTVHGGAGLAAVGHDARPPGPGGDRAGFRRVALRAASLIGAGDTVALDAGPSAYALALALPDDFTGSVITHSMPVMQLLAERIHAGRIDRAAGPRLVALGGELTVDRRAFVGPTTLDALAGLRARTSFLDASAVDVRGVYAGSTAEARVASGLADIADEVVLLATRDAFTASAPARGRPGPARGGGDRRATPRLPCRGARPCRCPGARGHGLTDNRSTLAHARIGTGSAAPAEPRVGAAELCCSAGASSRRRQRAAVSSAGTARSIASRVGPTTSTSIAAIDRPHM
jgi:DeoR/GlpR family transcriptional regulator of sugar metabolism